MDYTKHVVPMVNHFFDLMQRHDTSTQKGMVDTLIAEKKQILAISATCQATREYKEAKDHVEETCSDFESSTNIKEDERLFVSFNWLLNRKRLASHPEEEKSSLVLLFPIVARYFPNE